MAFYDGAHGFYRPTAVDQSCRAHGTGRARFSLSPPALACAFSAARVSNRAPDKTFTKIASLERLPNFGRHSHLHLSPVHWRSPQFTASLLLLFTTAHFGIVSICAVINSVSLQQIVPRIDSSQNIADLRSPRTDCLAEPAEATAGAAAACCASENICPALILGVRPLAGGVKMSSPQGHLAAFCFACERERAPHRRR